MFNFQLIMKYRLGMRQPFKILDNIKNTILDHVLYQNINMWFNLLIDKFIFISFFYLGEIEDDLYIFIGNIQKTYIFFGNIAKLCTKSGKPDI